MAVSGVLATENGPELAMYKGTFNRNIDVTEKIEAVPAENSTAFLQMKVDSTGQCSFSYSFNEEEYKPIGKSFEAVPGVWIGKKVGIFNVNPNMEKSKGYADFDWFRFE